MPSTKAVGLCAALIVIGLIGLGVGFATTPLDAWLWLVVGFLIFGGLAQGMLAWAAVFRTAQVRWTPAINRLGHSAIAFAPVSLLALIVLLAGVGHYAPWVSHPVAGKQAWLNVPFMAIRQIVMVGLLAFLNFTLVRWSLQADAKATRGEAITERDHYRLTAIAIAATITYALTSTFIALDFVMSLDPTWISTMFPVYFFVTNLYAAMGVLIILSALLRSRLGVERYIGMQQFQDMGNLMLGFALFSMGLFFAQYLTIWYGNLPLETPFQVRRYYHGPWPPVGWTAFIVGYALPFVVLQSRMVKRNPKLVAPVAGVGVLGFMLERYVMVVPSLRPTELMLAPLPGLALLAFAGAFVLAIVSFLGRYSPVSAADAALPEPEPLEVTP